MFLLNRYHRADPFSGRRHLAYDVETIQTVLFLLEALGEIRLRMERDEGGEQLDGCRVSQRSGRVLPSC